MSPLLECVHLALDFLLVSALAWACARGMARAAERGLLPHGLALRSARILFVAACVAPILLRFVPLDPWFMPQVEVWRESGALSAFAGPLSVSVALPAQPEAGSAWAWSGMASAAPLLGFFGLCGLWGCWRAHEARRRLRRVLAPLPLLRRSGRVEVRIAPDSFGAFSCVLGGRGTVVLPESLVSQSVPFRLALWHELQHLRARDPHWMRALDLATRLAPWHPLLPLWIRLFRQGQEFACDEALQGRRSFDVHDYGRLLLMVARLARAPAIATVGPTVAMAQDLGRPLSRRIEMLIKWNPARGARGKGTGWSACIAATCALFAAAAASSMAIADSKMDLAEAQRIAAAAAGKGKIPLDMNEEVLRWLNHYLGTPGGRQYMRASLGRMRQYEEGIKGRLAAASLPGELLFVPLVESGFRNFSWNPGAGLWGFIPATALAFELRVDAQVDERLDVDKSTDAALIYLSRLQAEFQDWRLALKAYNQGEGAIRKQIADYGSVDPWELERRSPHPEHYLGKFTAVTLIARSPELSARVD